MSDKVLAFIGNSHLEQFNLHTKQCEFTFHKMGFLGASIKGLTNENSTLGMKDSINAYCINNPDSILIFVLGQVDIEFGYYYKCVIDNIKYDISEYIDDLILRYEKYLNSLTNKFIILPINPTVILDMKHSFYVSFRDLNGKLSFYSDILEDIKYEDVEKTFYNDSYETRFNNNKLFNERLEIICKKNNYKYINFWSVVLDEQGNVKQEYKTLGDHHLSNCGNHNILDYVLSKI
jgi:hypothetical protein